MKNEIRNLINEEISNYYDEMIKQATYKLLPSFLKNNGAEEVVHEVVFYTLNRVDRLNKYDKELFTRLLKEGSFKKYIFSALNINCKLSNAPYLKRRIDEVKRQHKEIHSAHVDLYDEEETIIKEDEKYNIALAAIKNNDCNLTEEEIILYRLYYEDHKSGYDIADELNKSPGNIYRALNKIKEKINTYITQYIINDADMSLN